MITARQLQHEWADMDASRALRIQRDTANQVRLSDDLPPVRTVAGVDVGFENRDTARAAVVVLSLIHI